MLDHFLLTVLDISRKIIDVFKVLIKRIYSLYEQIYSLYEQIIFFALISHDSAEKKKRFIFRKISWENGRGNLLKFVLNLFPAMFGGHAAVITNRNKYEVDQF